MHRDIKSLNIFMTKDMVAKVADFGMCTPEKQSSHGAGTPQWMPPEALLNVFGVQSVYDNKFDVFSFAVLMWEVFHWAVPYATLGM